jgi:hypothetical protein
MKHSLLLSLLARQLAGDAGFATRQVLLVVSQLATRLNVPPGLR